MGEYRHTIIDWLDDVEIDNRQAIEMADTYRNVLVGILDAFDSVINNNLNMYMKRLSILNILMMVPTFITSFYRSTSKPVIAIFYRVQIDTIQSAYASGNASSAIVCVFDQQGMRGTGLKSF